MLLELLTHPLFLSAFCTWLAAGAIKFAVVSVNGGNRPSFAEELFKTGGMPSGHSAVVAATTMSVFFLQGVSTLFLVCAVFSIIIIRDSFGVRWSVGQQAKVLNKLAQKEKLHEKVKVVLGHTLSQAVAGIILGVIVAVVVHLAV
ncbi:divergent PAP2 family protein [Candidatus Woesearchaeota archaeon]|nr:divergent PAP2 family protein [Candidatus Woesearchaeota archaeon]